jgi:hypothetical protein
VLIHAEVSTEAITGPYFLKDEGITGEKYLNIL